MESRQITEISEDKFDLEPVLRAAKAHDEDAMSDFFKQGYTLSRADDRTHKTLLFILGEELDIETIRFIESLHDKHTRLNDAIEGAAFANHKVEDIEKISDLKLNYVHAYYGASKGRNHTLLDSLRERVKSFGDSYEYMNIHFIVSGAAEVDDQATLLKYTGYPYRDNCGDLLLSTYIHGAAYGGHIDVVEKLLQKHHLWDKNAITESGGYSIAYKEAMRGAARAGNTGLIAKLFLHLDQQERPMENPLELISSTIRAAASCGHNDLVFDLIGRARLYICDSDKHNDYNRVLRSALSGAVSRGRYKLAVKLCSLGLSPEDIVNALVRNSDKFREYVKLFKALNDAKFCYEIAHCQDTQKYNRCREDLIPVVNKMYEITPVSKEASSLYCDSEPLRIWLANYSKLDIEASKTYKTINRDTGKLVAEFVAGHTINGKAFEEACYLVNTLDNTVTPSNKTTPPQTVTNTIRKRILDEIDLYLKTRMIAHQQRAKALYSCVNKLNCIESIYLLIKHQISQMNGKPATWKQNKARSALTELAKTPTRTGHSLFSSILKTQGSLDFITRLENCLAIIEEYKDEPAIRSMLSDKDIYDKPSFSKF